VVARPDLPAAAWPDLVAEFQTLLVRQRRQERRPR
jgi:hypothetical protein